MEYCNSQTLKNYPKNKSMFTKISLINQILDGLSYLNSIKVLHRDLKPDNIFLHKENDGQIIIKIGDFGLSNFTNEEFILKKCGTPGFISPEILNYNKIFTFSIDNKVDIYSMGHIIHYIFTNSNIFQFEDLDELLVKNKENKYKLYKKLERKFKNIIKMCLKTNPKKRIDLDSLKEVMNNLN